LWKFFLRITNFYVKWRTAQVLKKGKANASIKKQDLADTNINRLERCSALENSVFVPFSKEVAEKIQALVSRYVIPLIEKINHV
jgi:hypothetical protein